MLGEPLHIVGDDLGYGARKDFPVNRHWMEPGAKFGDEVGLQRAIPFGITVEPDDLTIRTPCLSHRHRDLLHVISRMTGKEEARKQHLALLGIVVGYLGEMPEIIGDFDRKGEVRGLFARWNQAVQP